MIVVLMGVSGSGKTVSADAIPASRPTAIGGVIVLLGTLFALTPKLGASPVARSTSKYANGDAKCATAETGVGLQRARRSRV